MPYLTWDAVTGMQNYASFADAAPGKVKSILNMDLVPGTLGRRRKSCEVVSLTSGPSMPIKYLFRRVTAAGVDQLWAASQGFTSELDYLVSGTWTSVAWSDTIVTATTAQAAALNDKIFWAYNSDVNRLHVWDGTSMRRVGIEAEISPTVADGGGGGAYAATPRYYKVQWKIISGSNVIATSELSPVKSFTPSGANANATVTKPTTPDSATHWVVFGSADNVTYYDLSGNIAVGTTTYADTVAPSAYSAGTVAPSAGLYVPPPSAKYLTTDGNRLIMAGCWETTASSTQTGTRNSRVWFTAILGALDNTGEDEAIRQTSDTKHWIDVGENDGDSIVGLSQPLNGVIYVFKTRSIWGLSPTGLGENPYRATKVSSVIGATTQRGITHGLDRQGRPCVYFLGESNQVFRVRDGDVEHVSLDLYLGDITDGYGNDHIWLVWNTRDRCLDSASYRFDPSFEVAAVDGARGGWMGRQYPTSVKACAAMFALSGLEVLYSGGDTSGTAVLCTHSGTNPDDLATGTGMSALVDSLKFRPYAPEARFMRFGPAIVEYDATAGESHELRVVSWKRDGIAENLTAAITQPTSSDGVGLVKVDPVELGDSLYFNLRVTLDTTNATNQTSRPRILAVRMLHSAEGTL